MDTQIKDYKFENKEVKRLLKSIFLKIRESEFPPKDPIVIDEPIWYIVENMYNLHNTSIWGQVHEWVDEMERKGIDGISFSKMVAENDPFIASFYDIFSQ